MVAHQVEAAGAGVEGVGVVVDPGGACQAQRFEDVANGTGTVLPVVEVFGEQDAVVNVDQVGVQGNAGTARRLPGQAKAGVARFLRVELVAAECQRGGTAGRHGAAQGRHHIAVGVQRGAVVADGVAALGQRRGAEAAAQGSAYRHGFAQFIA
ncbi:hypothetical protein D3C81_1353900 [compost metagenome]